MIAKAISRVKLQKEVDRMREYLSIRKYISVLRAIKKEYWLTVSMSVLLIFIPYILKIKGPLKFYIDIATFICIILNFTFSLEFGNPEPYVSHSMLVGVSLSLVILFTKFHVDLVGSIISLDFSIEFIKEELEGLSQDIEKLFQIIEKIVE